MKKFFGWLLAFLLTGALVLFCVCFIGRRTIAPALGARGAAVSERVISAEKELIRERVTALSQLHGFTPEPVIDAVSGAVLTDLNAQASLWWSSLLADGTPGTVPQMDEKLLRDVLARDPLLAQDEDPAGRAETIAGIVSADVIRVVLPLRQEIVSFGMREAEKKVDTVNLVTFFVRMPWAALALCALLTGLIALLDVRECLKQIGSAMGAAAIVMIAIALLAAFAGIRPMIQEASGSLALQYDSVLTGMTRRTAVLTAGLLAGYAACMIFRQRSLKKHGA